VRCEGCDAGGLLKPEHEEGCPLGPGAPQLAAGKYEKPGRIEARDAAYDRAHGWPEVHRRCGHAHERGSMCPPARAWWKRAVAAAVVAALTPLLAVLWIVSTGANYLLSWWLVATVAVEEVHRRQAARAGGRRLYLVVAFLGIDAAVFLAWLLVR
jgi:hypothetical protein